MVDRQRMPCDLCGIGPAPWQPGSAWVNLYSMITNNCIKCSQYQEYDDVSKKYMCYKCMNIDEFTKIYMDIYTKENKYLINK